MFCEISHYKWDRAGQSCLSEFELDQRAASIRNIIKKIGNTYKLTLNTTHNLLISFSADATTIPNAHLRLSQDRKITYYTVELPYLFLIQHSDIPAHYKNSEGNLNFEYLETQGLLKDFYLWTKTFARAGGTNPTSSEEEFGLMHKFMMRSFIESGSSAANIEKFEKAKEFLYGHELAHIIHDDAYKDSLLCKTHLLVFLLLAGLGFGFGYLGVKFVNLSDDWFVKIGDSFKFSDLGYAGEIGMGIGIISVIGKTLYNRSHNHAFESRADLKSAQLSQRMREGGIYFYENLMLCGRWMRNQHTFLPLIFDQSGNSRTCWHTHPAMTKRVADIKGINPDILPTTLH